MLTIDLFEKAAESILQFSAFVLSTLDIGATYTVIFDLIFSHFGIERRVKKQESIETLLWKSLPETIMHALGKPVCMMHRPADAGEKFLRFYSDTSCLIVFFDPKKIKQVCT